MATKTILICDRCQYEGAGVQSFGFTVPPDSHDEVPRQMFYEIDMCPECMRHAVVHLVNTSYRETKQRLRLIAGDGWRVTEGPTRAELDRRQEHAIAP